MKCTNTISTEFIKLKLEVNFRKRKKIKIDFAKQFAYI